MEQNNNIELRTDEVRDILQKMPHWTIRWGISIIAGAVILLLLFSYLYRYPDLICSEIVISAANPPAEIKARSTGKITSLLVANDEEVIEGQMLAVIENSANLLHITELKTYLIKLKPYVSTLLLDDEIPYPNAMNLGSIQSAYSELQKQISDYHYFIQQHFYAERLAAIDGQIEMKKQLIERLELQKGMENKRFKLATNSYRRDSQLMSKSIISQEDYDNSQSIWLNVSISFEAVQKELVQTHSAIFELQQQKAGLQLTYYDELKAYRTNILRAYELVNMQVQNWYLNNVLLSPTKGKISFNRIWAVNQNVKEGETVLTVVPENPEGIVGKSYVTVRGAGKINHGQRVNIKLSNYPYMEYGMLKGEVKRKAPVPVNNLYAIEIDLPNQLTTNYGNKLDMQQELHGNCEIITEDLRLIQRIVYPIKALVERNRR